MGNAAPVPTGRPASIGNIGIGPSADPSGETAVPLPKENPGPSM